MRNFGLGNNMMMPTSNMMMPANNMMTSNSRSLPMADSADSSTDPHKIQSELAKSFKAEQVKQIMDQIYNMMEEHPLPGTQTDPYKIKFELAKSFSRQHVQEIMFRIHEMIKVHRLPDAPMIPFNAQRCFFPPKRTTPENSTDSQQIAYELEKSFSALRASEIIAHMRRLPRAPKKTARDSGFYEAMVHGVSNHVVWKTVDLINLLKAVPTGSIGCPAVSSAIAPVQLARQLVVQSRPLFRENNVRIVQHDIEGDEKVICDECSKEYKISQVLPTRTDVLQGCPFICPFCRLFHVDPWHQMVRILARNFKIHSEANGTSTLEFKLEEGALSQKNQVEVRCVSMAHARWAIDWPKAVTCHVNGNVGFNIEAPENMHDRHEKCQTIPVRPGRNVCRITFDNQTPSPGFVFAVLLTRRCDIAEISRSIKNLSFEDGKARIVSLLNGDNKKKDGDELDNSREISLMCPLTKCRTEIAAVGRSCKHLQFFDLSAYLAVNESNRTLNNRWNCPVCQQPLRPDHLRRDGWAQHILDAPSSKYVQKITVENDGGWKVVAEKHKITMSLNSKFE